MVESRNKSVYYHINCFIEKLYLITFSELLFIMMILLYEISFLISYLINIILNMFIIMFSFHSNSRKNDIKNSSFTVKKRVYKGQKTVLFLCFT